MDRCKPLQDLMLRYGLRRRDVAGLLGKPLNAAGGYSNSTVDRWLAGDPPVPAPMLELLRLKLAGKPERPDPWQRLIRQPLPYPDLREMERDLAQVMAELDQGKMPKTPRTAHPETLRRAGYLLELIAHFGGARFAPVRDRLLREAEAIRGRIRESPPMEPFRHGEAHREPGMDDLAHKWWLSRGADLRRFRQLATTGHA